MAQRRPTEEAYAELQEGYDFYNRELFGGQLPACMITFQREKRTMGYFSAKRFVRRDGVRTDEIAMNPEYFAVVPMMEVLQTLVHEMAHLWQYHFGKPSRSCYHNTEWADKMESVGLMPSDTGAPGGKRTGQKMGDYAIRGGRFEQATVRLLSGGFAISWMDRYPAAMPHTPVVALPPVTAAVDIGAGHWLEVTAGADDDDHDEAEIDGQESANTVQGGTQDDGRLVAILEAAYRPPTFEQSVELEPRGRENRSNRCKYTCPGCDISVWGKPKLRVKCADCDLLLLVAKNDEFPTLETNEA